VMNDFSNANYFPLDYDAVEKEFLMLDVKLEDITDASFLDSRMNINWSRATRVPETCLVDLLETPTQAMLFHTAFCGSTLLAKALDDAPNIVSLKEPNSLLSISDASLRFPNEELHQSLQTTLKLLGRPWTHSGQTLIKPTNSVNRLLPDTLKLMRCKAILLYSSIEEFIMSCCKKLPAADNHIRWMAQHLFHGTRLQRELGIPSNYRFHFLEACVIAWYAQMEWYAMALADDSDDKLHTLDMQDLMASPENVVTSCAKFLQFDTSPFVISERVAKVFSRNSKNASEEYSPQIREKEREAVRTRFGKELEMAMQWATEVIAPVAILPGDWKPLPNYA